MNFPTKCPYCGKDIVQDRVAKTSYGKCQVEIHRCIHCYNLLVAIYFDKSNRALIEDYQLVYCYPSSIAFDFPKRVKDLSPNCYKTFEQTMSAQAGNLDTLVGAGLRIALEWLVWDYLIKVKKFTEDDIKKLTLANRIEKMDSDLYTSVCARLIRLFGNDSVHIIKMLNFSTEKVIEIFDILCTLIDNELSILEVNARLNSSSN